MNVGYSNKVSAKSGAAEPLNWERVQEALQEATRQIAPVWPLKHFVAVNPYLGQTDMPFEEAAERLAAVGGIQMSLPVDFYVQKIEAGIISRTHLNAAFEHFDLNPENTGKWIADLASLDSDSNPVVLSYADIATEQSGQDWNRFMVSRISTWAASYFDSGQATWSAAQNQEGPYTSWKKEAEVDRTPGISGLKDFRKAVQNLPDQQDEAIMKALEILELNEDALPLYLHRVLLRLGGWSAYAARIDWDNKLYGKPSGTLMELLTVLVSWEACLKQSMDDSGIQVLWESNLRALEQLDQQGAFLEQVRNRLVLQEAFDCSMQENLITKINKAPKPEKPRTKEAMAQAVFCIDVRSEVFRRNLEMVDEEIETLGFAGFFGFPINYIPIGKEAGEAQCPVLIPSGPTIKETLADAHEAQKAHADRVRKGHAQQIWKSFKSGAISCFSFVSPLGLSYLPKLFTDSFGLTRPVPNPNDTGLNAKNKKGKTVSLASEDHLGISTGLPVEQRVEMARKALKAMSLTASISPLVMIVGHGATTVNNPHATGLDCGACGGHSGEANAKVAAAVLNDAQVRQQLNEEGFQIPEQTVFLACLHDTTTDEVSIFNEQEVPASLSSELKQLKASLSKAAQASRAERALRMPITGDVDTAVKSRSKDWSQVRPEWGLAGCSAFIVAPRSRTSHIDLGGKSFLHSYNWKQDQEFAVLESIMTAPMVVTSWINLQYYASSVDNTHFGSGNKTLHNITSGIGVLEGYSGDLRVGLPLQSVHDGEGFQHEPVRLNVIIEAPIEAMNGVLSKHASIRQLCDNSWIHLMAMNEEGQVAYRYTGNLEWEPIT